MPHVNVRFAQRAPLHANLLAREIRDLPQTPFDPHQEAAMSPCARRENAG